MGDGDRRDDSSAAGDERTMTGNELNPATGARFERLVREFLAGEGVSLEPNFAVPVGAGSVKKPRKFDLGSKDPAVLVECKCHVWTVGGNAPSAKLTIWNEAMLYFAFAPSHYRKLLVALRTVRRGETLAEHYLKRFAHLIPPGVELWELDSVSGTGRRLHHASTQ